MERSSSPVKRVKRLFPALLSVAIVSTAAGFLRADFEDVGAGARALGMGGAFTGLADDSRAIYFNPAGLAYLRRGEIAADYGRYWTSLKDNSNISGGYFSVAIPITRRKNFDERVKDLRKLNAPGSSSAAPDGAAPRPAGNAQSDISGDPKKAKKGSGSITFYKDWGTLGAALANTSLSGYLSQNTVWLSYGRRLRGRFAGGFSLKLLQESYTQNAYTVKDPVFGRGGRSEASAYTMDAGLLYNPLPKLFLGLFSSNMNNPSVALNPSDRDVLPREYKFGIALKEKKLNMAVDAVRWDSEHQFRGGVERWFRNRQVALRFGGGFGSRDYKNVSTGFSMNWGNFQLDYAVLYPISGVKDTYGNHKVSFIYRFGKPPANELAVGSIELYYSKLQQEMELLKARLEKSEDERSRLEKVLVEEALSRIKEKVRAEKLEANVAPSGSKDSAGNSRNLQGASAQVGGMKTYVVAKGDSLQSIAELFYGKKDRWMDIYNLNKDKVGRGGSLKSGAVLLIPGVGGGAAITESSLLKATEPSDASLLRPMGQTLAPLQAKPREAQSIGMTLAPLKPLAEPGVKPAGRGTGSADSSAGPAAPSLAAKRTHVVQPGETLSAIAQKAYGDPARWKEIYNANKDKVSRGAIAPGETLQIP